LGGSAEPRLLKILHIDPEKNWGGGEAQVFGLLAYLSGKGHRNVLLAHPRGVLFERCRALDVQLRPLSMRNDLDVRAVAGLRKLIRSEDFDIVHFHTKRAHALSLWLPRGTKKPKYVVTRRMDYPERAGWYTDFLYNRRVDGVIAISAAIAVLLRQAGVKENRIRRISSGVDAARFDGLSKNSNEVKTIGCIGVLEERKGQRFLLEAAATLKSRGFKLKYRFAGDGPLRGELEDQAKRLTIGDDASFLGFVADTAEFLAGVDLVVMPSLFEGLGVAALEAMAAGKPVVATRVGGLAESIIDGDTGIVVPPGDAAALADAIGRLAESPPLAAAMGRRGRERVLSHFTLEQMAFQNETYYYELLT
jgi:glycosyltransferase involved in cell wall biosynthesis